MLFEYRIIIDSKSVQLFFGLLGNDALWKHIMDGMVTSLVMDTPLVTLDVAVLINSFSL
jgi:hypothetical protein